MMNKTATYKDLQPGMGAVLGSFIRSSWILQNKRLAIIGIKCGEQNIFDSFNDSTDVVADLVLKLLLSKHTIDDNSVISKGTVYQTSTTPVYKVSVLKKSDIFKLSDLEPYIKVEEDEVLLKSLYQSSSNDFVLDLYIKETGAVTSEDINKANLVEAGLQGLNITPLPSTNATESKVTYTVTSNGISDHLEVNYSGSDADYNNLINILQVKTPELLQKLCV